MAIHAIRIMSADDYRQLRAQDALVIDLRRPLDYVGGHLEGALCRPGIRLVLRQQLTGLGPDRPLVLIAQGPVDVDPMIQEAQAVGASVAGILTGAPKGWQARGLPVLGWTTMDAEQYTRLAAPPLVVDIREGAEAADPHWPSAHRVPFSTWTADLVAEMAAIPVVLLGPTARIVTAAVALYEAGAQTVYCGQATKSKTVV